MAIDDYCDPEWPPGTVRLQTLLHNETKETETEIVLQPRPTSDPNDPLNWPKPQKIINYFLASFYAMMVFTFVNATSPTWGPLATELNFSNATLTNTYAIGCATLALGAPMLIPFALKYGSRPVYVFSSIAQFAISIWAAKTQTAADWWGVNAVQFWWWCAIFFGVQIIMFVFGFEETKFSGHLHETLEGRQGSVTSIPENAQPQQEVSYSEKDEKLTAFPPSTESETTRQRRSYADESAAARKLSVLHINPGIPRKTYAQRLNLLTTSPGPWSEFLRHSWQPFLILATIPGVLFCSLTYAVLLAWSTVMTTALSLYMLEAPYNFSASQIGLMSLAPFIGTTIGTLIAGPVSDYIVLRLAKRNNGIYEPEMRFWVFLPFIPFQLAGAWWFGYALADGQSWVAVALAYGISNVGSAPLQSLALTYLLDAYGEIIGDALTALTVVRNLFSTIFVFAMPAWVAAVGIPNVFNTIGAIGAAILCFAGVFLWKGKYLRVRTAKVYKHWAERQFEARPVG
ncbi:hypothetical protein LTR48_000677 [Friedmanniomyces endolithicus]|nr:hypothetical protein LTR48_000677 [Friedmanniomyces endolithicus]